MLSRRSFLELAGIAVASAPLPRLDFGTASAAPSFEAVCGRALAAVPVYAAPRADAPLLTRLWSDSVTPILGARSGWYGLPKGYAQGEGLQPMIASARRSASPSAPPFWGVVTGAVAVVRAWCAADAPIVTRVGHGGVLRVIDLLPGDGVDWYGVAEGEDGDLLGWTQTPVWSPAVIDLCAPNLAVAVDTRWQRLTVRDGARDLLTAPISTGRDLPPGVYPVTERRVTLQQGDYHGVPWVLAFGDNLHLAGAYWHNRFGAAAPGAAIQVTPPLAQWVYPRAGKIIIS